MKITNFVEVKTHPKLDLNVTHVCTAVLKGQQSDKMKLQGFAINVKLDHYHPMLSVGWL